MHMATETELKYAPTVRITEKELFECEYIAPFCGDKRELVMHTDYLDTPDGVAKKKKITLRRRFENGKSILYAKTSRRASGAFTERGEWSVECDDIAQAARLLADEGAPTECLISLPLIVRATVEFRRIEATVTPYEGLSFVLSYDEGHFGGSVPFSEIELELLSGTAEELMVFGEKLAKKLALRPERLSKYARALKYS